MVSWEMLVFFMIVMSTYNNLTKFIGKRFILYDDSLKNVRMMYI